MEGHIVHTNATSPVKRSHSQWKKTIREGWVKAQKQILSALAAFLGGGNCADEWVPVLDLFEESDMDGMVPQNIFKSLWYGGYAIESQSTFAYTFEENCYILLRHKFGPAWFILGCRKTRKSKDNLEEYIHQAMIPSNLPGLGNAPVSEQIIALVQKRVSPIMRKALLAVSRLIKAQKAASTLAVVTPGSARMSRNDVLTTNVQQSSKPLELLESLNRSDRKAVMQKLATKANRFDHLVNAIEEDGTALVLLEMFKGDISRQALVERLLNSTEVQESGLLFPRAFQFDLLSESSQSNMVHILTAIAIGAAKNFYPRMLSREQVLW
jgi:hypothetical protein